MDCSRDVDGDGGDGNKNNKLLAWILCAILGREFQRSSIHSNGTWPSWRERTGSKNDDVRHNAMLSVASAVCTPFRTVLRLATCVGLG